MRRARLSSPSTVRRPTGSASPSSARPARSAALFPSRRAGRAVAPARTDGRQVQRWSSSGAAAQDLPPPSRCFRGMTSLPCRSQRRERGGVGPPSVAITRMPRAPRAASANASAQPVSWDRKCLAPEMWGAQRVEEVTASRGGPTSSANQKVCDPNQRRPVASQ